MCELISTDLYAAIWGWDGGLDRCVGYVMLKTWYTSKTHESISNRETFISDMLLDSEQIQLLHAARLLIHREHIAALHGVSISCNKTELNLLSRLSLSLV